MIDTLSKSDWEKLKIFKNLLHSFYHSIIYLPYDTKIRSHCFLWECLIAIDNIREHLRNTKAKYLKGRQREFFGTAINTRLSLAQKHYWLIIKNSI